MVGIVLTTLKCCNGWENDHRWDEAYLYSIL